MKKHSSVLLDKTWLLSFNNIGLLFNENYTVSKKTTFVTILTPTIGESGSMFIFWSFISNDLLRKLLETENQLSCSSRSRRYIT